MTGHSASSAPVTWPEPTISMRAESGREVGGTSAARRLESHVVGVGHFLEALGRLGAHALPTPFQSPIWLGAWYTHIAPAFGCDPLPVLVVDPASGEIAAAVPLIVRREGPLRVVEFADLGLTDYNAPVLGPAAPADGPGAAALLKAIRPILPQADLVRLLKQPLTLKGQANPLARSRTALTSPMFGNAVAIGNSAEAFLAARGRKYRKGIKRSFRAIDARGVRSFRRAATLAEAQAMFRELEAQQRERMAACKTAYVLDHPAISRFYEDVLARGHASNFASIYRLAVDGVPVAHLYGIQDAGSFLLLRIAHAGGAWTRCYPGRLIVAETIDQLRDDGIRIFDMTIGDYAFKRGFGAEPLPLADTYTPRSLRGVPAATRAHAAAAVRAHPRIAGLLRRLSGRATRRGCDQASP